MKHLCFDSSPPALHTNAVINKVTSLNPPTPIRLLRELVWGGGNSTEILSFFFKFQHTPAISFTTQNTIDTAEDWRTAPSSHANSSPCRTLAIKKFFLEALSRRCHLKSAVCNQTPHQTGFTGSSIHQFNYYFLCSSVNMLLVLS